MALLQVLQFPDPRLKRVSRPIDEVTDARWLGEIGVAPTNGSFLAFVAAMILERGEEPQPIFHHGSAQRARPSLIRRALAHDSVV